MAMESAINLNDTPITALRPATRQVIVNELNKKKVLASEEGLPRDWRGLAHLTGIPEPSGDNPAELLLTSWSRLPGSSLGVLEEFLGRIDRWDIVDDVFNLIREDAKIYNIGINKYSADQRLQTADPSVDSQVLTFDDIRRLEQGLEPQLYDALLLYADQDEVFARLMYDRLENDYNLKVCLKESLVGGLAFEHQGILQLISERCRRVIIILSRSFLDSPVNRFSVSFAQALAIENRRRIIIPCVYQPVDLDLPQEIRMLFKLDYNRATLPNYNFWDRLRASVVQPKLPNVRPSSVTIREVNSSASCQSESNLRAIEPKTQDPMTLPQFCSTEKKPQDQLTPPQFCTTEKIECKSDHLEVKENSSGYLSTSLSESCKISCSTLSVSEKTKKKEKTKTPSDFMKKLFKTDVSKSKKSKKISVKL